MLEALQDAWFDSLRMLPFLLFIYLFIEWIETKWLGQLDGRIRGAGKAGPLIGALCGVVPQCGFSVIASCLYAKKMISMGTLLAVYFSTSDEAIPVILAQPDQAWALMPLILTKLGIAISAGYLFDFVTGWPAKMRGRREISVAFDDSRHHKFHHHHGPRCRHTPMVPFLGPLWHAIVMTIKVFVFVFIATFLLNLLIYQVGEENLSSLFLSNSLLQPVMTALIGLIPNCAASIVITQTFLAGAISFGSAISGLGCSAGLGVLVLFKENNSLKDTFGVLFSLLSISILSGILIQIFYG